MGEYSSRRSVLSPRTSSNAAPDSNGGWIWNLRGITTVLYRLTALLEAPLDQWVFVVEGEKDDRLVALGLVATCNPMGAGKWRLYYADAFKDRRVAIIPDSDRPGRDHARDIVASSVDVVSELKLLEVPAPYKDISEYFDGDHTREELVALLEEAEVYDLAGFRNSESSSTQSTRFW